MKSETVVDWDLARWQEFTGGAQKFENQILKSIGPAGEGNMNLTLRLQFESGTVIAKHAPPYCFKFPMIPAPVERLSMELEFFKLASAHASLPGHFPRVHHFDPVRNIALIEDLGECQDYSSLYEGITPGQEEDLVNLVDILSDLHRLGPEGASLKNPKMRKLNHEYIFILPYTDKTFDLTSLFGPLTSSASQRLGDLYLQDGPTLVHGDFYPRSWLKTQKGPVVIDPEFGFKGHAEFDVGVFTAHLKMAKMSDEKISSLLGRYEKPHGFKMPLAWAFAGCEIVRRLLHVAQLPLKLSPEEKLALLKLSQQMINPGV